MSYRSYCITVRPQNGLIASTEKRLIKWCEKHYCVLVTEMEGNAKHAHLQLWFDEPKRKGDIKRQIERLCEATIDDWSESQKRVLAQGVKISYSDWYLDYLLTNDLKSGDPRILVDQPPDATGLYYPSEAEQAKVIAEANAVDKSLFKLEALYLESEYAQDQYTLNSVALFLSDQYFHSRTLIVPRKKVDRTNMCKTLYHYINKSVSLGCVLPEPPTHVAMNKKLSELSIKQLSWE